MKDRTGLEADDASSDHGESDARPKLAVGVSVCTGLNAAIRIWGA